MTKSPINYKQRRENELYWLARAAEHSDIYLADAEKVADTLGLAYFNASKQLKKAAQDIFKNFQTAFNLSEAEARQLLEKYYGEKPSQAIAKAVNNITDEEEKLRLQAEMSAPAYQYRIKRLDTLAAEGKKLCETLYKVEVAANIAFLAAEYEKAYNLCTFNIQKGTGVSVAFEHVPKSRIDQVLKTNWSGKHFSTRVWDNTQELAQELSHVMAESFMTGESGYKTAQKIQERFGVGAYNARRLVRTENTYITGQAELESYEKSKIKEYKYAALMDKRTSDVCKELNGKIFPLSEAQAGKNYPPMHPFCRSSSIPIVPTYEELVAKEKEILEQIPDDMTFDEWLDSLEPTENGMLEFKPKNKGKSVDKSGESGISETVKSAIKSAKNTDELTEAVKRITKADVDLTGTDFELMKRNMEQLEKLGEEYGYRFNAIETTASSKYLGDVKRAGRYGDNITLCYPKKYYKSHEALIAEFRKSAADGSMPPIAGKNIDIYTTTHEFAHTLSEELTSRLYGRDIQFWDEIEDIYSDYKKNGNSILGNYAASNQNEFLAEAFANAKLHPRPTEWSEKTLAVVDKYFKKSIDKTAKGGIIKSGAYSGAKKTEGWQNRHAERMYEEIRHRKGDVKKIAQNTMFKESAVEEIKQHMFFKKHVFADGTVRRFDSDFDQAQAWDRLSQGNGTESDIEMLKHEYVELTQMRLHGYDYETAHDIANSKHNWAKMLIKEMNK